MNVTYEINVNDESQTLLYYVNVVNYINVVMILLL